MNAKLAPLALNDVRATEQDPERSGAGCPTARYRAQAVSPQVESGNVYLPDPAIAPWVEAFVEECSSFPHGKYDDQVDQMTQALNKLRAIVIVPRPFVFMPRPPTGDRGWMW